MLWHVTQRSALRNAAGRLSRGPILWVIGRRQDSESRRICKRNAAAYWPDFMGDRRPKKGTASLKDSKANGVCERRETERRRRRRTFNKSARRAVQFRRMARFHDDDDDDDTEEKREENRGGGGGGWIGKGGGEEGCTEQTSFLCWSADKLTGCCLLLFSFFFKCFVPSSCPAPALSSALWAVLRDYFSRPSCVLVPLSSDTLTNVACCYYYWCWCCSIYRYCYNDDSDS